VRVALAGCGDIAHRYATSIAAAPTLELVGATDAVPGRAETIAAEFGGAVYGTLDELLADDGIETVVNLTPAVAHAEVTAACLEAGKHVHSEKPLALAYEDAVAVVELASARGLRVSCAPATLMGEAQQTAWKLVREGAIGRVRVVYAEANWGRIETWHPSPGSLYAVGPLGDVGVYPLAILTAMFGPARRVTAYRTLLEPERTTLAGEAFRIVRPDFVVAAIELEDDVVVRMTASFYVEHHGKQRGIELHGDRGSIYLPTWGEANSRLELAVNGTGYESVPYVREPYPGIDWARPLVDLAEALDEGRPHRASAEQGAHLVELLEAVEGSARDGGAVEVRSTFERPAPMPWAV
jgi:predicted dehydrogenase